MLLRSVTRSIVRPALFEQSTKQSIKRCARFSSLTRAPTSHDVKVKNSSKRWCLVYGGGGALGQAIVKQFNAAGWSTISADFNENNEATENLRLDKSISTKANFDSCKMQLQAAADKHEQESVYQSIKQSNQIHLFA